MWDIELYETENGKVPVLDTFQSVKCVNKKLYAKMFRDIDLLEEKGFELTEPFSKPMENGIYELRTCFGNNIVRVFYFFFYGNKIVLTNGYIKKTNKTPPGELKKAIKYKCDYERRCGK